MKLFVKFLVIIFLLQISWSCKKKNYPESIVENEAVYYSNLTVDGKPYRLEAGVDDYYMYSTINRDSTGLNILTSNYKKTPCDICPASLEIKINDFAISNASSPIRIDSLIQLKKYEYADKSSEPGVTVTFLAAYNLLAASNDYNWTFGDGSTFSGSAPVHYFPKSGTYNVCLQVVGQNNCASSNCNTFKLGANKLRTSISANAVFGNAVSFNSNTTGGKAPYNYHWTFGDGTDTIKPAPTHVYRFAGAYVATLRIIDAAGDTAISHYNVVTGNDLSSCATNFKITNVVSAIAGSQNWGKVTVSWTDEQGVKFESDKAVQPITSSFEILSISDGGQNEKGDRLQKVRVKFNCKLFSGNSSVDINNAEAVIAVAYK